MKEEFPDWFGSQDDHDVIHFDKSSDLALSTSLNYLDFMTLHLDGQSIDVDAPPDIIDVDEDDDIIDDEDALPHELADSDDEYLVNVDDDDDDVSVMSADVARGHGGDGDGDDRPHPHQIGGGYQGHRSAFGQDLHRQQVIVEAEIGLLTPMTGLYNVCKAIRLTSLCEHNSGRLGAQISFGMIPRSVGRVLKNAQKTGQRAGYMSAKFSVYLLSSKDRQTYFDTHTVDGVFLRDEERLLYGLGTYTDDQIMAIVRLGKKRGPTFRVGRSSGSDDKMSQLLTQLQSQHEVDSGSGSDAGGDDEPGDNEDAGEEDDDS
ncbi:hypothetical protein Tco_0250245 [Tanacetum coccineum]